MIVQLNDSVQELGWCSLLKTAIINLYLPQHMKTTLEYLGLDLKVVRIPDGLEVVDDGSFGESDIEKLIIPNTVRELGREAFVECKKLREVVFEPGSQLETIGYCCFSHCMFEKITIPKSVRRIEECAFCGCKRLRSLVFEEGSQLQYVGKNVLTAGPLEWTKGLFPSTAHVEFDQKMYNMRKMMRCYMGKAYDKYE